MNSNSFYRENIYEEFNIRNNIDVLNILLKDRTTKRNIMWCTDDYKSLGKNFQIDKEISADVIYNISSSNILLPRALKKRNTQADRTRKKAEVFTPSWVCNKQINLIDNEIFGRKNVFNYELGILGDVWKSTTEKISFTDFDWRDYVEMVRMEITCGEAPYIVSRYDTTTGFFINVPDRIGMLDRKLRVVNENCDNFEEWFKYVLISYKSIYGFEYQGDSVYLARENLLNTFYDNYIYKFNDTLDIAYIKEIAKIISWNIWQMDGATFSVPNVKTHEYKQLSIEDFLDDYPREVFSTFSNPRNILSKIMDWKEGRIITFKESVGK